MDEINLQRIYLSDALDQVIVNSGASYAWHQLAPAFAHCTPALQESVLDLLQQHVPATGVPGFLRATFCASLLNDPQYFAEAGKVLLQMQPAHADRIVAFITYTWSKLLASGKTLPDFVAALNQAQIPALIEHLAAILRPAIAVNLSPRPVSSIRRVALITAHMGNLQHAPTKLLLDHAALLMAQGLEVAIFCCQDLLIPHMPQLLGNGEENSLAVGEVAQWASVLPGPLKLHFGNAKLGLLRRYANMVETLAQYDPDLFFMVGMYSPLMEVLYPLRPSVALAVHATAPIASCDAWACANPRLAGKSVNPWSQSLRIGPAFHYPFRVKLRAAPELTREDLGLPQEALLLVCVGYRLSSEIQGEWAERLCTFLNLHPHAILLLIGEGTMPPALAAAHPNQIGLLAHQEVVGGILACCDIYLNPARTGGGFSVVEAMAAGLPTLALAGADGGNKLAEHAQPNLDAYFAKLQQLAAQPALRQQMGAALQQIFASQLDLQQAGPRLQALCEQALHHFQQRTAQTSA